MRTHKGQRLFLGLLSVGGMVVLYTLVSNAYRVLDLAGLPQSIAGMLRPDRLPPTQRLLEALVALVGGHAPPLSELHSPPGGHVGSQPHATLQGALLASTARVAFGLGVGAPLGVLTGLVMGWSRRVDDHVHPVYVLLRSVPPLALVTYVMLWFGHGEAHRLIPIVYAVFTTIVIPTYHGVRDLAEVYVKAARALGAGRRLLFARVVIPAASPFALAGLRHSLVVAWMTTVGVEMLMGEDGIGHLLAGGGLWSSRSTLGVDPAVVIVGILGVAMAGYAMDAAARIVADRATSWMKRGGR